MLTKICSRCGKSYPANTRCECSKLRHKVYDKYQRNQDSADIYHSKQWQTLTKLCKSNCNGIDLYKLMIAGRIVIPNSGLSHHIVELTEDRSKAYDIDNLIYVGADSHQEIHKIYNESIDAKIKLQKRLQTFLAQYRGGG